MMDITTIAPYLIGAGILLFGPIVLVVLGSVLYWICRILFHAILFGWAIPFAICGNKRAQDFITDCLSW